MLHHHAKLERKSVIMLLFIIVTVLIGGIVEIIPLFRMETVIEPVKGVRPYTPLELAGFNIYIREGCYNCHSQQIRPLRDEVARYGHYSLAAESMYDHPFQWGSKRTGPDLARVGARYSDDWHVAHMIDPRAVVPESIMPTYAFLMHNEAKLSDIGEHMKVLRMVGVPYTDEQISHAYVDGVAQAHTEDLDENVAGFIERYGEKVNARVFDGAPEIVSEMDALVAYLQVLGTMVEFPSAEPVSADQKE
ncbi:MAG TPA: cytochrome-c oxidase, cbb3-type subunit II [Alphaproteobacteria bacterium]|nr:cytochrome-c oxidase, cbb3-type subunit II [Alphaproteobacteria bacterium]MCB9985402.1 cytochrome-c oxidase, cbb3-type subunit II [Micavibrio sp.]HRK98179.1 cytochrome-c oxidase, cbb3-type subunit II [Alphaproteobacteria bacterium]